MQMHVPSVYFARQSLVMRMAHPILRHPSRAEELVEETNDRVAGLPK